jgi:outer membrane immunogenic protein
MKKLAIAIAAVALIGTPAFAADMAVKMPVKAPPPAPTPVFSWTGCYIGAQGGYASGNTGYDLDIPPTPGSGFDFHLGGGVAGGHVGCNYQVNYFVIGIEGDGEWIGLKGNDGGQGGTIDQISGNWQTSVRGRLGVAFDRILVYGTGGGAWMNVTYARPNFDSLTIDNTLSGWTAGAGIEYAFWNNLTARVEYRYARFD